MLPAWRRLSSSSGAARPRRRRHRRPRTSETAKVYVGAGKKDGVTANDLVAVLTKELRFDRTQIGRIELRDGYSLIELPAQEAERLAGQLNGVTIRRKRVTARVDRGPTRPGREESERPEQTRPQNQLTLTLPVHQVS